MALVADQLVLLLLPVRDIAAGSEMDSLLTISGYPLGSKDASRK